MAFDYRVADGGLVLAEESMDAAAIEAALRQRDPDLRLQGWPSQTLGIVFWKVVRLVPDRPPETICTWMSDTGEPYPLSSALLDKVDRLDRNTRGVALDADARNRLRDEQIAKDNAARNEDLADDWNPAHGRPVLPRSQSLRMARDKQRARGKKV